MLFRLILVATALLALVGQKGPPAKPEQANPRFKEPYEKVVRMGMANRWPEMLSLARKSAMAAGAEGEFRAASVFDYAECQAEFAMYHYSRALKAAIRGREHALQAQDWRRAALNTYGMARVYYVTGNDELALQAATTMLRYSSRVADMGTVEMRGLLALILRRRKDEAGSIAQARLALEESYRGGSLELASSMHEQLGNILRREGRYEEAEPQLIEAYRLRKLLYPRLVGWSYNSLALLRLDQMRPIEALRLFTLGLKHMGEGMRPNHLYLGLAKAHLMLGDTRSAYANLEKAISNAHSLRLNFPFGDELQMGGEGSLQELFSLYVDVAAMLYEETGEVQYASAAFAAAQGNRAASLRTRVGADEAWRTRLPPEYWVKLNRLRREEMVLVREEGREVSASLRQLRFELTEMESTAGLAGADGGDAHSLAEQLPTVLPSGELLISFHLGERHSWRWVVSRDSVRMTALPARSQLARMVRDFRASVENDAADHVERGLALHEVLFSGDLPESELWTIVPDDTLFELPFAALVVGRAGARPVYLVEQRALRLAPTAFFFHRTTPAADGFAAVGDPIGNRADPRWRPSQKTAFNPFRLGAAEPALELARLSGSAAEMERCLRTWPSGPRKGLSGEGITVAAIQSLLDMRPRILHMATHVYAPPDLRRSPVIALGLDGNGHVQLLTDADIALLRPAPEMVTLSGCGSGRGQLAPGTGLMGLTRAWLMAGTQAVTASLWPVVDDEGILFEYYYQSLAAGGTGVASKQGAQALHKAQVKMLRGGGEQSRVSRWAGYFLIGSL